jgi:hypothetical protein
MGVRLYNPASGLFTTIDPVPGGGANNYAYPTDPVNKFDLGGQKWWKRAAKWAWKHRVGIAGAAAFGVCVIATVGACAIAGAVATAASISYHGYNAYRGRISYRRAAFNIGSDYLFSRFKALRSVKIRRDRWLRPRGSHWVGRSELAGARSVKERLQAQPLEVPSEGSLHDLWSGHCGAELRGRLSMLRYRTLQ